MTAPSEWWDRAQEIIMTPEWADDWHALRVAIAKALAAAKAEGVREALEQPMDPEAEAEIGHKLEAEYQRGRQEAQSILKDAISPEEMDAARFEINMLKGRVAEARRIIRGYVDEHCGAPEDVAECRICGPSLCWLGSMP